MHSIGTIRSPFTSLSNMPVQPLGAMDIEGKVVVDSEFEEGLNDLEGFSHIYLLYHFHKAERTELSVVPFLDTQPRGVFATRSPLRPGHIGLSIVELLHREANVLTIRGVDILDNTPLLDIKPYIPAFDKARNCRTGWFSASTEEVEKTRSDSRFR